MVINHTIFGKKMEEEAEIELLDSTIKDCRSFLQFWLVYVSHRSEAAEDAFVAITELERECRVRLDYLVTGGNTEDTPF